MAFHRWLLYLIVSTFYTVFHVAALLLTMVADQSWMHGPECFERKQMESEKPTVTSSPPTTPSRAIAGYHFVRCQGDRRRTLPSAPVAGKVGERTPRASASRY